MNLTIIQHGSPGYEQMLQLRIRVLLQPIGVPATFIQTEKEKDDILIGAFEEEKLIGCCVLTPKDNKTIQLRQMAVDTGLQGSGIGASIVAYAEEVAKEKGFTKLMMHARSSVTGFYLKSGYEIIGDAFEEVGIAHRLMQKLLS
jgi:N-acetylglutamate synthase-like GNAT family acetyltransferase